ncbi:MAG: HDIG domain-containing protein [Clostridiales bacterium]|jgi:putative nucleotidyltransferase with HDIG domain|nr:HDIG domain-containing protein [Clostridiales bacterium]
MKNRKRRGNNFRFISWLVTVAFIFTCAAVITGGYARSGYVLEVGKPSPAKFVATRDVINSVATDNLKEEARKSVMDVYVIDTQTAELQLNQARDFFQLAFDVRRESNPIFTPYSFEQAEITQSEPQISSYLSQSQIDTLLAMDTFTFNDMQENIIAVLEELFDRGIRPDGLEKALADARGLIADFEYQQDVDNLANSIAAMFIEPNQILDAEDTERRRNERANQVEPVMYLRNQKIVDENEIITQEYYVTLQALGFVNKSLAENILPSVGAIIIIALIFVFTMLYVNYFHKEIIEKRKTVLLIFCLYVFMIIITWFMINVTTFYLLPVLIFTMLISMLISSRLSVFLNFSLTVITMLIFKGDIDFLIYYLIAGTSVGILAKYTDERSKIILVGLLSGLVNVAVLVGYNLFIEANFISTDNMRQLATGSVYAALSGLFSVIIATGSLPIWEALFGIITPLKLLDLTNPNSGPLARLTIEAPGTYHHSLIVANLAETAAADIGANPAVARVGGYYHDIGKLKYPQYFVENAAGENPHDSIDPYSSVAVIKSHVDFGLEMAQNYRLPAIIKDMIEQHHGNTLIKYFYIKTKNENPEKEINENDFRYNHKIPTSKEAAVVMLADTVEAAVRAMIPKDKPLEEVEAFVRSLIKDKLDDGQLAESGLTIKDVDTAAKAFMRVFKGMYHERIPYPKEKKSDAATAV